MSLLSVKTKDNSLPLKFHVSSNYPNPFNPSTKINIQTITESNLNVSIFDLRGRLINTLFNNNQKPGFYNFEWSGSDKHGNSVPSGIYFIQVKSGLNINTQKVALMK